MANSTDFLASVYDTLSGLLNTGGLSQSSVMQMAWPGYSLSAADFKAPDTPNGPYDVDVARESFSQLSNIVPALNKTYFENSGFEVDDLYEILLSSAIPVTTGGADPATNPLHKLFSDAQFELMQARRGYKSDPNRFYYPCTATPGNWFDEAATQTWSSLEIKSSDVKPASPASPFVKAGGLTLADQGVVKLKPTVVDEQSLKSGVTQTIERRDAMLKGRFTTLTTAGPSKPLDAQLLIATGPRVTARAVPGAGVTAFSAIAPATATPALQDKLGQARLSAALTTKSVPVNAFLQTDLKTAVQSARINPQTLTIESSQRLGLDQKVLIKSLLDQRLPTKPVTPATSGWSISFKFCRVNIDRPWFKLALLSMPNWYMFNTDAKAYSTGTLDNNPGMFPFLPLSFVAIRDLKITANWSPEDRASVGNAVSFGFFDLRNGQFNQNTYEVRGLQIIAWLCRLTPPLPPSHV